MGNSQRLPILAKKGGAQPLDFIFELAVEPERAAPKAELIVERCKLLDKAFASAGKGLRVPLEPCARTAIGKVSQAYPEKSMGRPGRRWRIAFAFRRATSSYDSTLKGSTQDQPTQPDGGFSGSRG